MKKGNYFSDNPELAFQLTQRTDFEEIFQYLNDEEKEMLSVKTAEEYQNAWIEVLESMGEVIGNEIAPKARQVEKEPITLKDDGDVELPPTIVSNMNILKEVGLTSLCVATDAGGMAAPFLIEAITHEMINRACPSTTLNAVWYGAVAHIIEKYGNDDLKQEYLPRIASGEMSGNMALTEPEAGSDLANIRSYGEKQDDGTWKLYGNKIWISNGSGDISLVLAKKSKGSEGLNAINLFLCPRKIDGQHNYKVTALEEKVGLHGSATCELLYEGSKAYLLGKEGEGFRYMLDLMNDARIAVSFQGIGSMEATLRLAKDFAETRKTWGKPIARHELIAEKLLDLEVELKAFRSVCHQAAVNQSTIYVAERYLKREKLNEERIAEVKAKIAKYQKRVRRWTPLIKYFAGEKSVEHARTCLQIHGGSGFTTEYDAEFWVRESLIYAIYEGTSQIQALMCVKDLLKEVVRNPMEFVETALGLRVKGIAETDSLMRRYYKLRQMSHSAVISIILKMVKANVRAKFSESSGNDLVKMIKLISRDLVKFENLRPALLHAERITEIKVMHALAEAAIWDYKTDPSRKWIAERYINKSIPRVAYLKELIENDDEVIANVLDKYDEEAGVAKTGS